MQFTLEKRFSNNWNAQGSYTYSRTEGNHFARQLHRAGRLPRRAVPHDGRYVRSAPTASIPCAEVKNGANKTGRPTYDRPHNFKLNGAYVRPIGPVNLTFGALTEFISKRRYEKAARR